MLLDKNIWLKVRYTAEYIFLRAVKGFVLLGGPRWHKAIEKSLFFLAFKVFHVCRDVVDINLKIAFPHLTDEQRLQLTIKHYRWLCRLIVHVLRMDEWKGKVNQFVSYQGLEHVQQAHLEGQGMLILSAHFGNWEMIMPGLAALGYSCQMYTGKQSNPMFNDYMNLQREQFGIPTIVKYNHEGLKITRALKANQIVGMLVDQNDRKSTLFVKFFGKLASFSEGPARFHLKLRCAFVMTWCTLDENGRMVLNFKRLRPVLVEDKATNLQNISQEISNAIEEFVSQYPEQFFWVHRRWKTRPPEDRAKVY